MPGLRHVCGALIALVFISSTPAYAQEITATIRGQVVAPTGETVADATVQVTHVPSGSTRSYQTNSGGTFYARGLRPGGPYRIEVPAAGGNPGVVEENVFLQLNQDTNIALQLGRVAVTDEIIVRAEGLDQGLASASVFSSETISELPSISRDFKDIIRRDPLVSIDPENDDAFSIGGVNNRFNTLTVDGVRQNDDFGLNNNGFPTQRSPISIDAIEQVSVLTAPFDVEFGQFLGGTVNIVTKSGGNDFHGSGYFFYSDDSLVGSRSKGDAVNLGTFEEKTYGGTLSGPIVKDKLFFFVSYEKFESTKPAEFGTEDSGFANSVPGILQSDMDRIAEIANRVYGFDPLPRNVNSLPEKDEKWLAKLDWNITEDHRAQFTYQNVKGNILNPQNESTSRQRLSFLSNWYDKSDALETYVFQLFSDWSDAFSTEVKIGRKEVVTRQEALGDLDFAEMEIDTPGGGTVFLGPDEFRHANFLTNDVWQFKVKGDYLIGDHLITVGYELDMLEVFNLFVPRSQGVYTFDSIDAFEARMADGFRFANAFTGDPNDGAGAFGLDTHSIYIQDTWEASDDITLVLGLRWDFFEVGDVPPLNQSFVDRHGFANTETLDGKNLIQPRFGFTWDVDDRTLVRGGAGIFGGGTPNVWISNSFSNDGQTNVAFNNNIAMLQEEIFLQNVDGFTIPTAVQSSLVPGNGDVNAIDPNFKIPSAWKFNLAIEHEFNFGNTFGDGWLFTAEAIWTRTRNAVVWQELRRGDPIGTAPDGRPIYAETDGFDLLLTNTKQGKIDVYTVSVQKEWDFGLMFYFGYAYQDSNDLVGGLSSTASSNYGRPQTTDRNNPAFGTSDHEIQHRFTSAMTFKRAFFGDNETTISFFLESRSGRPWAPTFDEGENPFGGNGEFTRRDSQLFYVPEVNDPNVLYADDFDMQGFDKFIADYNLTRGEIVEKNSQRSSWVTRLDFRLTQQIPSFWSGHKFIFYFDIENLTNLISNKWGRLQQVPFWYVSPVVDLEINDQGQYVYSNFSEPTQNLASLPSVWKIQFGIKYQF